MAGERRSGDTLRARLRARARLVRARQRPYLLFELVLVAVLYALYAQVRDLHGRGGGRVPALAHGHDVMTVERTLHLDPERWLQSLVVHHHEVLRAMAVFYLSAHVLVTAATLIFLYVRRPRIYRRARNVLVLVTFAAVGLFAVVPTAPPRLLRGSGLRDTLAMTGGLWSYNNGALEKIADPYAAMPSLHLGWSTWVAMSLALAFGHWSWRRRALFFAYPTAVALNVLATGTHWLLDTVAGSALLVVLWGLYAVGEQAWRTYRRGSAAPVISASEKRLRVGRAGAAVTSPIER